MAFVVVPIRRRITQPVFDTAISLIVPFAAYLPAEELQLSDFHGSGVIAVVVAGLILGHKSPVIQTGQSRLSERVNWATIQFLLENTVFLLIGLQARRIVNAVSALRPLRPPDRRVLRRRLPRGDRHPAVLGAASRLVPVPARPRPGRDRRRGRTRW